MAKQLYDYWFVQFDFPDANGKPYKSSGGKMVWNEKLKREIPVGWEVKNLGSVAEIVNGATPSTADEENYGGDIVWITPKDLSDQKCKFIYFGQRTITEKGYKSCSTSILPVGTVLMSSRAPIGLVSIAKTEVCTNQGFKSIVPNDMSLSLFIYYYIKQNVLRIQSLGVGTTFMEVSKDKMEKFPILIPKDKLLAEWTDKVSAFSDQQFEMVKQLNDLTAQREYLLPLLMNGQVSVKQLNSDLSHD
ncbi:MAG: restriction endonuclease subunit S [Bacteroidales bacterium]|nr:restriction endonuclease subunit S [Bacteroidales bacterium]